MKRKYFDKELVLAILFSGTGLFFFGREIIQNTASIFEWIVFIVFVALAALVVHTWWYHRQDKELKQIHFEDIVSIEFDGDRLIFPSGYLYKYSKILQHDSIAARYVNEINLHTSPPSFVFDNIEVVYVPRKYEQTLRGFGETNQIPLTDRFDIWAAINEPYLDTELEEKDMNRNMRSLLENGLTREEVERIRKKVRAVMLTSNSIAWEWVCLGQFDYLNWTWLTEKKYWWSMSIALRNYEKK